MSPERWARVKALMHEALDRPLDARDAFLDAACGDDAALRAEVVSLLRAHDTVDAGFLEAPAYAPPSGRAAGWIGRRVGAYRITAVLGEGGMGEVYEAVRADDQFEQRVAIKLVRRGYDTDDVLARFRAERQILASLQHPNIARLLDGGVTDDGLPYFVMEHIAGEPIDTYCRRLALPLRARVELFRTVCAAVHDAHQRLVVHRDIKPNNILVTSAGEVKLLDFGIAKLLDPQALAGEAARTATMMQAMTPEFASPEQLRGETVTTASDVYSLGVLLFRLLTGASPYRARSRQPHEIARAVLEGVPERPSAVVRRADPAETTGDGDAWTEWERIKWARRLDGDLDDIVLMALRKEAARRYTSVEQLAEDLRRYLDGQPVRATRDTFVYRARKFVGRHRVASIATTLVVLALAGGVVAIERSAREARAERARAERHFNEVRKVANAFMLEVHDLIQNLPGSMPARKLLATRALEYLDALSKEDSDDLGLWRELATAYEKVGEVQGGYRVSSLGDTAGALDSFRKSLTIRESLAKALPDDVEVRRDVMRMHGKLGDLMLQIGDMPSAMTHASALLAEAERTGGRPGADFEDRRLHAVALLDYGFKLVHHGDWRDGVARMQRSIALIDTLTAERPEFRMVRLQSIAYARTAGVLMHHGEDYAKCRAMYEKSLTASEQMQSFDLQNTDTRQIVSVNRLAVGLMTLLDGDARSALASMQRALDDLKEMARTDPTSVLFAYNAAYAHGLVADAYLHLGEPARALVHGKAAVAGLVDLPPSGTPPNERNAILAVNRFRIGRAYALLAEQTRDDAVQRTRHRASAVAAYKEALPGLRTAFEQGELAMHERAWPDDATRAIAQANASTARVDTTLHAPRASGPPADRRAAF